MASVNDCDLSPEVLGEDLLRIPGAENCSRVTIGTHRGAGSGSSLDERLSSPGPETLISAVITRTGSGQEFEYASANEDGGNDNGGGDDDDDGDTSSSDENESVSGRGGRRNARHSTSLSDMMVPPLGVANHTKRNLATIEELLLEADSATQSQEPILPRLENAMMMSTYELLTVILGVGKNPWMPPSTSLIGRGGEVLGTNIIKFAESWNIGCLANSPCSQALKKGKGGVHQVEANSRSKEFGDFCDKLDRSLSVSRANPSVELLTLVYLFPLSVGSNLRRSLISICSGGESQQVAAIGWHKWFGRDMAKAEEDVRSEFQTDYLAYQAVIRAWTKLVRKAIDDERPRISIAKVMAGWSSISVVENDTLSSFLSREDELWVLMTNSSKAKDEAAQADAGTASPYISWDQRRERLLSAMLSHASWRRLMSTWWDKLSNAGDYNAFTDIIRLMRESGIALRMLPRNEACALKSKAVEQCGVGPELYYCPGGDPNDDPHAPSGLPKPVSTNEQTSRQGKAKRKKSKPISGKQPSSKLLTSGKNEPDAIKKDPKKVMDFREGRCFDCHLKGHKAADCPKKTAKSNIAVEHKPDGCTDPTCVSHSVSAVVSTVDRHRLPVGKPISKGENDLLLVDFYDSQAEARPFRALLDSGSQGTLVASNRPTTPCSHFDPSRRDIIVSGVGGNRPAKPVILQIRTAPSSEPLPIKAYLVSDLPLDVDVIVGIDCLRQLKAKIDFSNAEVALSSCVSVPGCEPHASPMTSLGLVGVQQQPVGGHDGPLPPLPVADIECHKRHPTIRHRGYPITPEKLRDAEETLRDYESKGYIEFIDKNCSPDQWISPCFLKRKKSGAWRLLTDLRAVNRRLPVYCFPGEAHTEHLLSQIPRWATHFASLDVRDAFYTVRVTPASSELLGATLGYRTFRWKVLAQGLSTAPYWWSRQLHWILSGIPELTQFKDRVVILTFVDDILICGDSKESTGAVLNIIIKRLSEYDIPISTDKTQPPTDIIGFLGMRLSPEGWQPEPAAVAALQSLPRPVNKQQLQSVLGSINYLRAAYDQGELQVNLAPLQDLLGKNKPYRWTELHDTAFDWLRTALKEHIFAYQPIDSELQDGEGFVLQTDASDCGVSYVLWRVRFGECPNALSEGGELHSEYSGPTQDDLARYGVVLMAGGRRLRGHERRYATFDCEGLALVEGLRRARVLLLIPTKSGRRAPIAVQSDGALHKMQAVPDYSDFTRNQVRYKRWCRWVESIVDVLPYVRMFHCRGVENSLSDMFSRVLAEADTDTMGVYCAAALAISDHFDNSSVCSDEDDLGDLTTSGDQLASFPVAGSQPDGADVPEELVGLANAKRVWRVGPDWVYQDCKGRTRTYVPEGDRAQVLSMAHGDGHASAERMLRAMLSTVWWPKMSPDIDAYCSTCVGCARHAARAAAANPRYDLFSTISAEAKRFSSVAMDHLGPFNGSYVLVVVDKVTGWLEACVVDDKSAQSTALALYDVWVSRWGWFDSITHDNDAGFCSAIVRSLFERHQVKRTLSPPYWPRGNGVAEAAVKEIKYVIRRSGETITSVAQLKALVAAARLLHNSSASDGCVYSPYEIVTGKKPKTLLEATYGTDDPGPADSERVEGMLVAIAEQKRKARDRSRANAIERAEKWRSGSYGNDLHEGDLVFVVQQRGYSGRVAIGPVRVGNVNGSLVYLRGEEDPVSRGQCVPYSPDPRYPDVAGEDHQAMKVEFHSLAPDMMVMFEVEELGGQVRALDVARVASTPVRDKVKVEPYASPSHLFWFRRQHRERRLVTVSKTQVKFSTSGSFLEPDGKLSSESIELLIQRGYIQQ